MTPNSTRQALRQVLFSSLIAPPLVYNLETGPVTLPIANVQSARVWNTGGVSAPSPLVTLSVSSHSIRNRLAYRAFNAKIQVVSSNGADECEAIYEAVRARLQLADQQASPFSNDLSRSPNGAAYGLAMLEIQEHRVSDTDFERETSRWYLTAELGIVAL
jgi:hypothetical protein